MGSPDLVVIALFGPNNDFQPQPLEELTVEQPPDDVEIEPDEQTDAFTVSVPVSQQCAHHSSGSQRFSFQTLRIAVGSCPSLS